MDWLYLFKNRCTKVLLVDLHAKLRTHSRAEVADAARSRSGRTIDQPAADRWWLGGADQAGGCGAETGVALIWCDGAASRSIIPAHLCALTCLPAIVIVLLSGLSGVGCQGHRVKHIPMERLALAAALLSASSWSGDTLCGRSTWPFGNAFGNAYAWGTHRGNAYMYANAELIVGGAGFAPMFTGSARYNRSRFRHAY